MTFAGNRAGVRDGVPPGGEDRGHSRAGHLQRQGRRLALTAVGLTSLTVFLLVMDERADLDNVLLLYLLAVVIVAITAGRTAALGAAVVSFVLEIYLFASPRPEFARLGHDQLVELAVFLVAAVLVSVVADAGARHRAAARRHEHEAKLLSELAAIRTGGTAPVAVLAHARNRLGFSWLRLVQADAPEGSHTLAQVGDPDLFPLNVSINAGHGLRLEGGADGPPISVNALVLQAVADTLAQSWREEQLAEEVARARQLAEIDRVRNSLLDAVSHDLRTPLAGIKANASALRQADADWTEAVRAELLAAIEESADQLTTLVTNLLAMSRIRAGAVSATLTPVPLYEVVSRALVTIGDHETKVDVPEHLPMVLADQALLERVVANLVTNAHQHAGDGLPIVVRAESSGGEVRLSVVDHGPGIPEDRWAEVFQPFQRLQDTGAGAGLGLSIARGFTDAMGATLQPSRTPGGGLTMSLILERSR
ncbi:MAG TPA: ATP-binding protein [Nocardioides sp.]|nr:ATP-binding protein [Nocardioides sp.]